MKKETWDRVMDALEQKTIETLRDERENLRQLYEQALKARDANGAGVKKRFAFPVNMTGQIANETADDFDVTATVSGNVKRTKRTTVTVHASGTEFFGDEADAEITRAKKGSRKKSTAHSSATAGK